jgi:HTH-type transcriptional regulator / antitoxin HipB
MLLTTPSQVGEVLRARRKARKISQAQLAAKLGIGQSRLSTLERDASGLTLDRLLAIARILGLDILVQDDASPRRKSEW